MNTAASRSTPKVSPLSILLINQRWFTNELRSLGHRVISATHEDLNGDLKFQHFDTIQSVLDRLPDDFTPDRIVYYDNSSLLTLYGFEELRIPSLFYSVDAHHHASWHSVFGGMFSKVLVAQKNYLKQYQNAWRGPEGSEPEWMPLWATQLFDDNEDRPIDVCFRGTLDPKLHPRRSLFFNELQNLIDIDAGQGPYGEAYPRSKIVVNQCVDKDLNFRVFEAMSAGALLITPRIANGMGRLFKPGRDLVLYESEDPGEVATLVRYYLTHEAERRKIASQGRERILAEHTPYQRAQRIEQTLQEISSERPFQQYLGAGVGYLLTGRNALALSKDEDPSFFERVVEVTKRGAACLVASAKRGERCDRDYEAYCLLCTIYLEDLKLESEALDFASDVSEACSDNLLLGLNIIDLLLKQGRHDEARAKAEVFSPVPDEFLRHVPKLLKDARASIRETLLVGS
jgi:hypothetical protein